MNNKANKTVWRRLAACFAAAGFALASFAPVSAFGAEADGGNAITGETLFGDVDGSATTVGDVLAVGDYATKDDLAKATPADYANVANLASNAAPQSALSDYALKSSLSSLAPLSSLTSHTGDTSNPHAVTAAQVGAYSKSEIDAKGYLTADTETDPTFSAWANGTSIVAGKGASVGKPVAVAIGYKSVTLYTNAVAVGVENKANSSYASAVGMGNTAQNYASSAFGRGNVASGWESSAFGMSNTANEEEASSFGYMNYATASKASAFGWYNTAKDERASAFGYQNEANAWGASAFGYYCQANGQVSCAFGYSAYTGTDNDKWYESLAFSQTPDRIYLNSKRDDFGATARTLQSYLDERATTNAVAALADKIPAISATDPTFSNAVLAVTTSFDTNTVAQINELLDGGTVSPLAASTGVGAALAAIAAALAALKKSLAATDAKVSAANVALEEVA